ncbi:hypothetical protein FHR90_003375 [Endobacter medicaginis]|uniref:STAS/SEC14 domain-containing protein n=1 Tax=Endobacter medicaginis TaxID=1181271 RepID=A0A839V7M0_9PROT|nr:hypothetical protein [Endobacter medicaginis]MBB3175519.1 hypothetical protein [Endobacter medicaginis]MCX5477156.1 hypothetical protein [Endobacter medicaginis]NVN30187.1 hypothetical protein [Endobacter medicaginis]
MGGFFDGATIVSMKTERVRVIAALPCPANAHITLCDIRQMKIQSQERVQDFARLVGGDDIRSKRLAFVTGASLARIQAKRLTDRPGVEFFSNPDTALNWLREPEAAIDGGAR